MKCVRSHVMKMLHRYSARHVLLRDRIGNANTIPGFLEVCQYVRELVRETLRAKGVQAITAKGVEGTEEEGSGCSQLDVTSCGFRRADEDAEYCVSWYRRYSRNADVDFREEENLKLPCGAVNLGAKIKRDRLLNLATSFNGGGADDLWQLGDDEENCSLFGTFFASE